ncbi:GntR family transcriptional regulator [Kitasatospora sp. NBC_00070]|uniref:GntR family transcriptional regulator n=1 Tax=Kitasatospora sp. NBC_00070 TaxID=2975962 RepID=UPI0032538923
MTLPLEEDPRPPYLQAADVLRAEILEERIRPGEKLPSTRTLQERYGIASSTVQNALRVLKDEGLVYSVQGRGSYVRSHEKEYREKAILEEIQQIADQAKAERAQAKRGTHDAPADPGSAETPVLQAIWAIREAIVEGRLKFEDRLPDLIKLQLMFATDSETVERALRHLAFERLVHRTPRGSLTVALTGGGRNNLRRSMLARARVESLRRAAEREGETLADDFALDEPAEEDSRPPYIQVADILRREILDGELKPGSQLPAARALQERFGVASSTVQNALRLLKGEDLIYSVLGRGSYVRKTAVVRPSEQAADVLLERVKEPRTAEHDAAEVVRLRKQVAQLQKTRKQLEAEVSRLTKELERRG